jgi:hypothetical protein
MRRVRLLAGLGLLSLLAIAPAAHAATHRASASPTVPRFDHVVEVLLENEGATATFEDPSNTALHTLKAKGVYIPQYYAAGHASLDNYIALFGAEQPNAATEGDCLGMAYDSCWFPASVPTLGALFDAKHLPWKVYSEGMDAAPAGHNCLHAPVAQLPDPYQGPLTNGYATRHNPAPWFQSVTTKGGSEAYCQAHSVDLTQLWHDARSPRTLPAWSFVEPDTCHDGHDDQTPQGGCAADPEGPTYPSGVAAINAWLPGFVHQLTTSPGWDSHSLLVITFDEAGSSDTSGCPSCHDTSAGGRIGMLLLSGLLRHPGTTYSGWQGDHYGLDRTVEAAFGLPTLKSKAAGASAAALVHDGDRGVKPLSGIWK